MMVTATKQRLGGLNGKSKATLERDISMFEQRKKGYSLERIGNALGCAMTTVRDRLLVFSANGVETVDGIRSMWADMEQEEIDRVAAAKPIKAPVGPCVEDPWLSPKAPGWRPCIGVGCESKDRAKRLFWSADADHRRCRRCSRLTKTDTVFSNERRPTIGAGSW